MSHIHFYGPAGCGKTSALNDRRTPTTLCIDELDTADTQKAFQHSISAALRGGREVVTAGAIPSAGAANVFVGFPKGRKLGYMRDLAREAMLRDRAAGRFLSAQNGG